MSFAEYCNHMRTKYTIATALAVIKSKPEHLTIDEYITELKQRLVGISHSDNISITSNDFNMDDDESDKTEDHIEIVHKVTNNEISPHGIDSILDDITQSDSPTILANYDVEMAENDIGCAEENTMNKNEINTASAMDVNVEKTNETIKQTNTLAGQAINNVGSDDTQETHCSFNKSEIEEPPNKKVKPDDSMTQKMYDSQATQIYTIDGYAEENTHISQSQNYNKFEILEMYVLGTRKTREKINKSIKAKDIDDDVRNADLSQNILDSSPNDLTRVVAKDIAVDGVNEQNRTTINANSESDLKKLSKLDNIAKGTKQDTSKDTTLTADNMKKDKTYKNIFESANLDEEFNFQSLDDQIQSSYDNREMYKMSRGNENTLKTNEENVNDRKCIENKSTPSTNEIYNKCIDSNIDAKILDKNNDTVNDDTNTITQEYNNTQHSTNLNNYEERPNIFSDDEKLEDSDEDVCTISQSGHFKVLEELSKVRRWLGHGRDEDSGYRSSRSGQSVCAVQLSPSWLNQAAHTLFNHLATNSLEEAGRAVCEEVSQVLGELIDTLHNNENYPPFLDDLLNSISAMLKDILEEESEEPFEKEATIHRLLSLNKSYHTITYSIEHITNTLHQIHKELTTDSTQIYEITKIGICENLSYVFSVLERLLKRHIKTRAKQSQSNSQVSQDSTPQYSGVIDIWKKKWDPGYMTKNTPASPELSDVSEKLAKILNRITIDCMDGYSLIAFAALQCFNMLQS